MHIKLLIYNNPSIIGGSALSSEGVGSFWPFATGKMVTQANLLLEQILNTQSTRYILVPNQNVGAYKVGFMPEWIAREFLARRGGAKFTAQHVVPARCPLLGYALRTIELEGQTIGHGFLQVESQPEVGTEAYDRGAKILTDFFRRELEQFLEPDLLPEGRRAIECFLSGGSLEDYVALLDLEPTIEDLPDSP